MNIRIQCASAVIATCCSAVVPPGVGADSGCIGRDCANAAERLPASRQWGGVRYITGGIGIDEADAMRAVRRSYPLALTFVVRQGNVHHFTSRVQVEIQRDDGSHVLSASSDGPYLFAELPPGRYRISARGDDGVLQRREVSVGEGRQTDLTFEWSADRRCYCTLEPTAALDPELAEDQP